MNNNKIIITKQNLIGYILLIFSCILSGLEYTDFEVLGSSIRVVVLLYLVMILFYLFIGKYNKKALFLISSFLIISLITYLVSNSSKFLTMLVVAIVFSGLDYKKAFKLVLIIRTFILIMIMSFAQIGILDRYERTILKSKTYQTGFGMGYTHPNRLAFVFLFLILTYICYKNTEFKKKDFVLITVIFVIGYYFTKTRTLVLCFLVIALFLVAYNVVFFKKITSKIVGVLGIVVIPMCTFISLVVPKLLGKSGNIGTYMTALDKIANFRFANIRNLFETYPITLFGGVNEFVLLQSRYNYSTIDNGYIRLLFNFGIIGFMCFLILSILTIVFLVKKEQYNYVAVCIVIAIWGVSENILTSIAFNLIAVFWNELIRNRSM